MHHFHCHTATTTSFIKLSYQKEHVLRHTHITRAPISPLFNPFSTLALNSSFRGFFVLEVTEEGEGEEEEEVTRMVCLNVKLNG